MNDNRSKNQPRVRKFPSEPTGEKGPGRASKGGRNKEELLREMGNRLRQIRLEKNWTQDKMAECLGITKAFYGKIERGESSIALEKLALLNETMDIDLNYLITGETIPVLPINFQDVPREKRYSMEQLIKYAVSLASSKEEGQRNENFIVDSQTSRPVGPFFKGAADGGEESDCNASQ